MGLVAVLPVYDEFGQQRAGEINIDVRQAQDIVNVLAGLPVVDDALRLGTVLQAGGVARPLYTYVLDKLGVQGLGRHAAFAPVEDELGYGLLDEVGIDAA